MTLAGPDLRHHGDAELAPGLVDLAVNVRPGGTPSWLRDALAGSLADLGAYPDAGPARAAVAARHDRPVDEVLLTAGAAEAFVLLARALRPRCAVVVHPQFTEPEAALRAAGHPVRRVVLRWPFTLDPAAVPADADLVVVGNPTNPTSVLHPADALAALARPGRTLVVDEAFADCVPGEPESLAARRDIPGLVVVRSLTKTWGLAGLRIGYVLADAATGPTARRRAAAVGGVDAGPRGRGGLQRCAMPGPRPTAGRVSWHANERTSPACSARLPGSRSFPMPPRPSCWSGPPAGPTCETRCGAEASPCAAATRSRAGRRLVPGRGARLRDIRSLRRHAHGGAGMTLLDQTLAESGRSMRPRWPRPGTGRAG